MNILIRVARVLLGIGAVLLVLSELMALAIVARLMALIIFFFGGGLVVVGVVFLIIGGIIELIDEYID